MTALLVMAGGPTASAAGMGASFVFGQGGSYTTNGTAATATGLNNGGVSSAIDLVNHRWFHADWANNRVLVYNLSADNFPIDATADFVLGQTTMTASTSGLTQAKFLNPNGVAYDPDNNYLYVADGGNNRVLVFDVASITNGENAINVLGQGNYTSNGAAVTTTGMSSPRGLDFDATNNRLFVTDGGNHRVLVYDVASITNGEAAASVLGQTTFTNGTTGLTQGRMNDPYGSAWDSATNYLYVADSNNSRVLVFDVAAITNGENAINVIGQTNYTTSTGATTQSGLRTPNGVSAAGGYLYVGDSGNHRIMKYSTASLSNGMNATDVIGQTNYTSSTAATTQTGLNAAQAVLYVPSNGTLYVDDQNNNRALIFVVDSTALNASFVFGQGGSYTTSGTAATATGLNNGGTSSALDLVNHRWFHVDWANHRVLVYNLDSTNYPSDATADFVLGQTTMTASTSGLTQAKFFNPNGVAYDPDNNYLYVADGGNNRVLVFDVASITNGENAINVLGQANYTSNGAAATSTGLSDPRGIAFDATNDRLFVPDGNNHRIIVFNTTSITNGEAAVSVLGQTTFTANTGATAQNRVNSPYACSWDSATNYLYVADATNNRVLVFDVASITDGENASNVLGQANFTSSTAATTQSGLSSPMGVSAASGHVYVGDMGNNRIMDFDTATLSNGENATGVIGQPFYVTNAPATSQNGLRDVQGVLYDAAGGRLYVDDQNNNRALVFVVNQAPSSPTSLAQYRSDGTTSITTGGYTNQTSVVIKATVADADTSDTVSLCVEMQPIGVSFTNSQTSCGSAVSQGLTASHTLTVSHGNQYHWQVRSRDARGMYSSWVQFNSGSGAFTVDTAVPSSPTSLAQYKSDGTTALGVGGWNNSTTVVIKATVTDATTPVSLCVEAKTITTALTGSETCSTAVSSGSTATVTLSSLTDPGSYYWRARTLDSAGNYSSSWTSFGGNSDGSPPGTPADLDFGIDTTAPSGGTVYDGTTAGVDTNYNDGSLSSLSANWSGVSAGGSGVAQYEYAVGTTAGGTDVRSWTSTGTTASVTATGLTLRTSVMYYVSVRTTDNAGNVQTPITSNGQVVAPTLSFTVSTTALTLPSLHSGNSYTSSSTITLTTSTNGYGGYQIRARATALAASGSNTLGWFNGGTYASPDSWQASDRGVGYTVDDTLVGGVNKFQDTTCPGGSARTAPGCFAPFSTSSPGDVVADHASGVTGTSIVGEVFTMTMKTASDGTQAAGSYQTQLLFTNTVTY